jgi:hypothetical protein
MGLNAQFRGGGLTDAEGEETQEGDGMRAQSPAERSHGLSLIHLE